MYCRFRFEILKTSSLKFSFTNYHIFNIIPRPNAREREEYLLIIIYHNNAEIIYVRTYFSPLSLKFLSEHNRPLLLEFNCIHVF